MSWNAITEASVLDEFTPTELAVLQNIQGATTQLPAILARVVSKVRSQIKAGGNQVDQSGQTIPDQLVEEVIAIARWKWLSGFPSLKALKTDERKSAAKDAEDMLKEISSNKPDRPRTELPAIADTVSAPVDGVQIATKPRRTSTSRKLNGLI